MIYLLIAWWIFPWRTVSHNQRVLWFKWFKNTTFLGLESLTQKAASKVRQNFRRSDWGGLFDGRRSLAPQLQSTCLTRASVSSMQAPVAAVACADEFYKFELIEGVERLQFWNFEIIPKIPNQKNIPQFLRRAPFGGPGILLINLCSTVLAANHWALQLAILPIIGFSALLFTVLALFIIPKAEFGDGLDGLGWVMMMGTRPGERTNIYSNGKIHHAMKMGTSTISIGPFSIAMLAHQRVYGDQPALLKR